MYKMYIQFYVFMRANLNISLMNSDDNVSCLQCYFLENKTKMRKNKGMCAFFWQTRRAVKRAVLYCYRGNKVDPETCSIKPVAQQDPADPQPSPSSLDLDLTTDPGPSGLKSELTAAPGATSVEMTRKTDPADPEPSSVSGPSSLQLTPDSDPTSPDPLPVPSPSCLEPMAPQGLADPQTGASNPELTPHTDLVEYQPVNVSPQSNLELTVDPEPKPVPGPSGVHAELTPLPGPSAFSPAVGESFVIIITLSYCYSVYFLSFLSFFLSFSFHLFLLFSSCFTFVFMCQYLSNPLSSIRQVSCGA